MPTLHVLRVSLVLLTAAFAGGCCCDGPMDRLFNGCCLDNIGERYDCNSCGEAYYGDWCSHAPSPQPCDCYGNYTGQTGPCGSAGCSHLNHGRLGRKLCRGCATGCSECVEQSYPASPYVAGRRQAVSSGCATCGH
ncbi:MAG: hypothetical protein QM811_14655 [Pirellulales bacterium]